MQREDFDPEELTWPPQPISLADLDAMPDDGNRYELLEGQIFMTPAPVPRHQRVSFKLQKLLDDGLPDGFELFAAPTDLDLIDDQRVMPDLVIVPAASVGEKRLVTPALLVVEITSPRTRGRDYVMKREAYAASGVEHYWVIDVLQDRVVAHKLDPSTSAYAVVLDQTGGVVELREPIPVSFELAELLAVPD